MPYGLDRSTNDLLQTSSYKFTDQEQDDGTGLYNYDARLYDPILGQFIMADTIVPDMFNPQSLNRYTYCLNNPLIYVDPTGHFNVLGFTLGTAPVFGENNAVGFNTEKGILSENGMLMTTLSFTIPGLQAYSEFHDEMCNVLGFDTTRSKAISNIAIVTLPAFAVYGLVVDLVNAVSTAVEGVKGFLDNISEKGFLEAVKGIFTKEKTKVKTNKGEDSFGGLSGGNGGTSSIGGSSEGGINGPDVDGSAIGVYGGY